MLVWIYQYPDSLGGNERELWNLIYKIWINELFPFMRRYFEAMWPFLKPYWPQNHKFRHLEISVESNWGGVQKDCHKPWILENYGSFISIRVHLSISYPINLFKIKAAFQVRIRQERSFKKKTKKPPYTAEKPPYKQEGAWSLSLVTLRQRCFPWSYLPGYLEANSIDLHHKVSKSLVLYDRCFNVLLDTVWPSTTQYSQHWSKLGWMIHPSTFLLNKKARKSQCKVL